MSAELTPEEMEEAVRRAFAGGPDDMEEDAIQESLDAAVDAGLMERDGDTYRMTAEGNDRAEELMREALSEPAPFAASETHLLSKMPDLGVVDDDQVQAAMSIGVTVVQIEARRLADRIEEFPDDWAPKLADLIRRGQL